MIMTVGRNDPCPCGSGKKYKCCCFLKRETPVPETSTAHRELILEYVSRRTEIEAAVQALEKHRRKFEKLTRNPAKFMEQAEKLFAEPPFADMRFSADQLQRAFEDVGYPTQDLTNAEFFNVARKAVRFLIDDSQRNAIGMRLMLLLPDYVKAGRYLDAWIIQHSAFIISEPDEGEIGAFLLAMFMHGFREWEEQREREQREILKKLGADPDEIRRMGYEGVETWMKEMMKDAGKTAAMSQFLDAYPELKAMSEVQCRRSEDAALSLLQREDARDLLLSYEEVVPWCLLMEQRMSQSPEIFPSVREGRKLNKSAEKAFGDLAFSVCAEMAAAVFTAPRLNRLAAQIHEYRRSLSEEDREAIAGVHGALLALQSERKPAENPFLFGLCFMSVRAATEKTAEQAR